MWYFKLKWQKTRVLVKASYKQLKVILILEVKKLGPAFIMSKLGEFLLFNKFLLFDFPDLNKFWDLADF